MSTPTEDINAKVPRPVDVKSPIRFSISGKQHLIPNLQSIIESDATVAPEYKTVILSELSRQKSNAAQVDLHVVDHNDGGTSVAIHIKPVNLG